MTSEEELKDWWGVRIKPTLPDNEVRWSDLSIEDRMHIFRIYDDAHKPKDDEEE